MMVSFLRSRETIDLMRNLIGRSALSTGEGRAPGLPLRKVWPGHGRAKEHAQGDTNMIRNLLATTAIATLVATGAYAQPTTTTEPTMQTEQAAPQVKHAEGHLASNLIGETVYNGTGDDAENIGSVTDMVISNQGQIEALVVGVGGFLGIGRKDVALEFSVAE